MKEKTFRIARLLVHRSIMKWNAKSDSLHTSFSDLSFQINDTEKEIMIFPCASKYMFNIDDLTKIAESLGAKYYIDVTKNLENNPCACFVIYF